MRKKKHVFLSHISEYEIPFFDVDSMNVVWHGYYVKYLEMARCAFLETINYHYEIMREQGFVWPIVQLNLKYVRPARFRQKIEIEVQVIEFETCFRLDYIIRDKATQTKLTEGSTTQAAVEIATEKMLIPTPQAFQMAIRTAKGFKESHA